MASRHSRQSRDFRGPDYQRVSTANGHDDGADSDASEDLTHAEGDDVDLPEDVYGATIFSVVHDSIELMSGKDHDHLAMWINRMRVLFVVTSLLFNYTLQLSLLFWSYLGVVMPAVNNAQTVYKDYHTICFDVDGTFNAASCQDWESRPELCNMVISRPGFLYLMLCLWWMTMLNEFRKTDRVMRKFQAMVATRGWDRQIETDAQGVQRVKKLVWKVRLFFYIVLIFPKHVISVGLLVIGTWWLVATDSFENLILNALALGFVIEIDELIFSAMFPAAMSENLAAVKLWRRTSSDPKERQLLVWQEYRRSATYWMVILVGVFVYLAFLQSLPWFGVLPGYANDLHCKGNQMEEALPICDNWAIWNGAHCFPFGAAGTDQLPPHPEIYGGGG